MTKEEYVKKTRALRDQRLQIEKEYAETNTKYEPGMKIKVTKKSGSFCFGVVKFSVVEYDEVVPYAHLYTKTGEESNRRLFIVPGDKVEIVG